MYAHAGEKAGLRRPLQWVKIISRGVLFRWKYDSVRPKPPFWIRPDTETETETQKLAVTFSRYQN